MIYTTLNKILRRDPCEEGWNRLLCHLEKTGADDEPLGFDVILDSNGLADCLWALRAAPEHNRKWRHFACDCAGRVLHLYEHQFPYDVRPRRVVEMAMAHTRGEVLRRPADEAMTDAREAMRAAQVAADAAYGGPREVLQAAQGAAAAAKAAAGAAQEPAWRAADYASSWANTSVAKRYYWTGTATASRARREAEMAWQENRLRELLEGSE
jgi:hypothetical protein